MMSQEEANSRILTFITETKWMTATEIRVKLNVPDSMPLVNKALKHLLSDKLIVCKQPDGMSTAPRYAVQGTSLGILGESSIKLPWISFPKSSSECLRYVDFFRDNANEYDGDVRFLHSIAEHLEALAAFYTRRAS